MKVCLNILQSLKSVWGMLRRVTKSLRLLLFTKFHNHISPICPTMIPSPMWSVVLDFSFAFATFIWVHFCKVIFSSSTSYFQIFSVLPRLILFPAPPDSISIQSVGGLAIRPGGLLTVTEDVVSQVRLLLEFSRASLAGKFEIEKGTDIWYLGLPSSKVHTLMLSDHQVECVTRFSNPSPSISWSLGGRRLPSTSQTNSTEPGTNKWR